MPTVDTLLQELGKPPRDICLDWAWQIQDLFAESGQHPISSAPPLVWSNLELDECGLLQLRNVTPQVCSPEHLLQQLMDWLGGNAREDDTKLPHSDSLPALIERLCELTLADPESPEQNRGAQRSSEYETIESRLCEEIVGESEGHSQSSLNDSSNSAHRVTSHFRSQAEATASAKPPSGQMGKGHNDLKPSSLAKASKSKRAGSSQLLKPRVLAVAGILVGTVPLLLYFAANSSPPSADKSSVALQGLEAPQGTSHPAPNSARSAINSGDVKKSMDLNQSVPLAIEVSEDSLTNSISGPVKHSEVPAENPLSRFTDPLIDLSASPVDVNSNYAASEALPTSKATEHATALPENPSINEIPNSNPQSPTVPHAETDIVSEVSSASKSAGAIQSETELMVDQQNEVIPEPLLLPTSPAIQIQKLPPRLTPRPRQPMWRMAIGVDDEFTISPSEPVTLKEKEFASWTITSSDAKAPRTSLKIAVQMSSGRQAALRWTVAAVSEDLPNFTLPLGEKILQPLQDKLRLFSQAAPQEVERLKQLAASGVPSDVRSAINRERAALDSQGKFAARMLTFVASAQQFDAWMHGHVTVFAELRDGTEADSPIVLRFGDLEHLTASEQAPDKIAIDSEKSDIETKNDGAKSE